MEFTQLKLHFSPYNVKVKCFRITLYFTNTFSPSKGTVNRDSEEPIERFEINTPPLDPRSYCVSRLANKLRILLVHDPAATTGAVSLTVGLGTLSQIEQVSGVGNFLRGKGGLKAVCPPPKMTEDTLTYSFEIEHSGIFFYAAVDKFARLFVNPRLDKQKIASENSGEPLRISGISWPISLIQDSLGKDLLRASPLTSEIDKESLYSANIMTLAVLTKDPIETMEKEIGSIFKDIPDNDVERFEYTSGEDPIWHSSLYKHKIYIVPKSNTSLLRLHFIHPDVHREYKTNPLRYASYLIEHQGPTGLASKLSKEKLCMNLSTDYNFAAGVGNFNISCNPTKTGLEDTDKIIKLIFQYIKMLSNDGIQDSIFRELRQIDKIALDFKDTFEPALPYVERLAVALQNYPYEDVLLHEFKRETWDSLLVKTFFSYLEPSRMNVSIASRSLKDTVGEENAWYGMRYKIEDISDELLKTWSEAEPHADFKLPVANDFIPEFLDLFKIKEKDSSKLQPIQDSYISQIWFRQNNEFKTPKLHVHLHFWSPMSRMDPSYRCLLEIFLKIMNTSLRENLHNARVAGINWSVTTSTYGGIIVDVYGYEDKLYLVLEEIISTFTRYDTKLPLNEKLFMETKQEFQEDLSLRGVKTRPSVDHGWEQLKFLLSEAGWSDEDLLIVLEPVNFEDLQDFLPDLMTHIYIQGLIHGNCPRGKAMEIVNMLEKPFESIYGLLPQQLLPGRIVKLTDRSHFVYVAPNKTPETYAYYAYYQLTGKTLRDHVTANLLVQTVDLWCRDLLGEPRPEQYSACGTFTMSGIQGIFVMVTSDVKEPRTIDSLVEQFIKDIPSILNGITDEQFKKVKADLKAKKTENPKNLKALSEQYFFELENRTYYFNRYADEVKDLETLQKSDLLTLYKQNLDPNCTTRSKLAVYIIPDETTASTLKMPSGATKIENTTMFKSSLRLLPLPRPQITVSAPGNKSKLREVSGEL